MAAPTNTGAAPCIKAWWCLGQLNTPQLLLSLHCLAWCSFELKQRKHKWFSLAHWACWSIFNPLNSGQSSTLWAWEQTGQTIGALGVSWFGLTVVVRAEISVAFLISWRGVLALLSPEWWSRLYLFRFLVLQCLVWYHQFHMNLLPQPHIKIF